MNAPLPGGLEMARSVEEIALREAGPSEVARTLTSPLVEALWDSGLMQFMNPTEAGGSEPGFAELIDTWVELARQDGSLGWIGIANFPSACFAAAFLPDQDVRVGDVCATRQVKANERNLASTVGGDLARIA